MDFVTRVYELRIELAFRFKYLAKEHFEILIDEAVQIYKMTLAFYIGLSD